MNIDRTTAGIYVTAWTIVALNHTLHCGPILSKGDSADCKNQLLFSNHFRSICYVVAMFA
jgi:hypothetical protein